MTVFNLRTPVGHPFPEGMAEWLVQRQHRRLSHTLGHVPPHKTYFTSFTDHISVDVPKDGDAIYFKMRWSDEIVSEGERTPLAHGAALRSMVSK